MPQASGSNLPPPWTLSVVWMCVWSEYSSCSQCMQTDWRRWSGLVDQYAFRGIYDWRFRQSRSQEDKQPIQWRIPWCSNLSYQSPLTREHGGNSWTSHYRPHRYVHAKAPRPLCNSSSHGSHWVKLLVPRDVDTRTVRPAHDRVPGSQGRDEAWIDHVFWINIEGGATKGWCSDMVWI